MKFKFQKIFPCQISMDNSVDYVASNLQHGISTEKFKIIQSGNILRNKLKTSSPNPRIVLNVITMVKINKLL